MSNFCQVFLTCADNNEADSIIATLLRIRLIACGKKLSVDSKFLWKGNVDHNDEVLLIMESREDLFERIEAEVEKLHSYETFVLQAIPMSKLSKEAAKWLDESLID